ncbi:hypothetical protein ACFWUP_21875 [Nocardia sp. NPDC058658]|uniref:hypothetical protein n=1 Tax=Nocardia sp. NPDC058658 TaxID=3346580 RepID=UPI003646A89B
MNVRNAASAAAALNFLTIAASVVVNKLTGFSDWPQIVAGSALLTLITAAACALAWYVERKRSRGRSSVTLLADGGSQIEGSVIQAAAAANVKLAATSESAMRGNAVEASSADVEIAASDRSRIDDQDIEVGA